MKSFNFFFIFIIFSFNISANAQQTLAYEIDNYGPTLIIGSSLPSSFDYMHSKNHPFSKSTYRFVNVNYDANNFNNSDVTADNNIYNNNIVSTKPKYKYLDVAINDALAGGWRHIRILEGVYHVNNPIIINNIRNTTNRKALGRITIEGEGYGTQIFNAPTYTNGSIFQVKSGYNTIKNMSIISDTGSTIGRNTCIHLLADNSAVAVRNNIFENLYLGTGGNNFFGNTVTPPNANLIATLVDTGVPNPNYDPALPISDANRVNIWKAIISNDGSALDGFDNYEESNLTKNRTGIHINALNARVEYNKFKNISLNGLTKGVIIEGNGTTRVNDNIFENFNFDNNIIGVDFKTGVWAWDNVFNNLSIQTKSFTINFIKNISGTNNLFRSINNSDWNGEQGNFEGGDFIKYIKLAATSSHSTIADSELNINSARFLQDNGSFTQLINCFNSGDQGVLDYKLGSTQGTSKINLLGRVIVGNLPANLSSTINADYRLLVNGKVLVKDEVYVKNAGIGWADYVFAKDYKLMPLNEVEQHIKDKGYLPNMPSAAEVEEQGIAVGDLIKRQQEKIEELTLYMIEMQKENKAMLLRLESIEQNQKK
jgi:hypothetical protein